MKKRKVMKPEYSNWQILCYEQVLFLFLMSKISGNYSKLEVQKSFSPFQIEAKKCVCMSWPTLLETLLSQLIIT